MNRLSRSDSSITVASRSRFSDSLRPLARSRIVEAMHGTILAANRGDRSGAVLTIRLPIPAASNALDTAA